MRKVGFGLALLVIAAFLSCRYLLPERFAVNAPIAHMLFGRGGDTPSVETIETRFQVPKGYSIGIYAEGIPNARLMRFTPTGELLVSTPRRGQVILLDRDRDSNGRSDGQTVLLDNLNDPHGLDLHAGWLYVAEADAIGRIRFDASSARVQGTFERIVTGLPGGGNHRRKTLRFGPDGWLYLSVGSSCNVCVEEDARRAAILRFRPDGSDGETFATGLRNTVGFDWRPETGEFYGTDNGRDMLGDNFPPCELNRLERNGDYGWPYAHGDRVPDPGLGAGEQARIATSIPPAHAFRAHNAPLGMTFIRAGDAHPELRGAALVALHGSWNRTEKDGYKVVSLHWDEAGGITERDFMVGFLRDDDVVGRPVDVAEGPDGAIYVSDDYAGVIWRIARTSGEPLGSALPARSGVPAERGDLLSGLSPEERRDLAARGRGVYRANPCATCHGSQAAGGPGIGLPLSGLRERYSLSQLEAFLRKPTPPMPTPLIDDRERRELAVYLLRKGGDAR